MLVTGATRGIGRAIASRFIACGHRVIGTGRDADALQELAQSHGPSFTGITVDFLDRKAFDSFLRKIKRYEIDVLVNNAGTNRISPVHEIDGKDWDDIIFLNLSAPMMLMKALSPHMMRRRFGRIVNVSSIYSSISRAKRSSYSASKAGLNGITRACALDLAEHGVLVNAVSPGFTRTELTMTILSPKEMRALAADIPLRRFAEPDEIAKLVFFLGSGENTYITGQNFIIDGGYSIQ